MNLTTTEMAIIGLLLIIASQTSYTTYRQLRNGGRSGSNTQGVLVDTSVLMDGRIMAIAETGFLPGSLVIPRSVVGELQFLADNADSEKRERARRGLDVIKQLQLLDGVEVEILQDGSKAAEGVDERLLLLAKKNGMKLCTIDFNLNKVAQVENIPVLNVNELARNLRMTYLPGDKLQLELATTGSDSHQAVGHLGDGTMVVVEQASSLIGTIQEVEVTRSLQTAAGKMMFARLTSPATAPKKSIKKNSNRKTTAGSSRATTKGSTSASRHKAELKAKKIGSSRPVSGSRKKTNEDRLIELARSQ